MEIVVAIAIGVLSFFLAVVLIALIFILRQKCKKTDMISEQHKEMRPDAHLIIESSENIGSQSPVDVELGDVKLPNPKLEQLLNNEQWVDDAMGLVPHCLSILKTCHYLTQQLVEMTMQKSHLSRSSQNFAEIIIAAKRINPRVNEVVQSIYPPLDPRLLEARFTALVLSVSHLVMITKNACKMSGAVDWIDQSLNDVEDHLKVLRNASAIIESHHTQEVEVQVVHPGEIPQANLPSLLRNDISQF